MKRLQINSFFYLLSTFLFLNSFNPAFAQRGAGNKSGEAHPNHPMGGYPNFFDANTLPQGQMYFEFPTLTFDYGLTERATIGTNVLPIIYLAEGAKVVFGKARYRIMSTENTNTALTGYYGYLMGNTISEGGSVLIATSNTTWFLSDLDWFNFSGVFTRADVTIEPNSYQNYVNGSFTSILIAASYSHFFNQTSGIEFATYVPAYTTIYVDTAAGSIGISSYGSGSFSLIDGAIVRFLYNYIPTPEWLLSFGALALVNKTTVAPLPLAFVGYRW